MESKSTPSFKTIAASPGAVTASHFPWGMAIPSPMPVEPSSSLASTLFLYDSLSFILPLLHISSTILSMASSLDDALPLISMARRSSKSVIFINFSPPICSLTILTTQMIDIPALSLPWLQEVLKMHWRFQPKAPF